MLKLRHPKTRAVLWVLTDSLPSVPIPEPRARPPNRGLQLSVSPPAGPPPGGSVAGPEAWGLEMTVEFFMLSAVVTGACFPGFPPNSLRDEGEGEGEGDAGVAFDWS